MTKTQKSKHSFSVSSQVISRPKQVILTAVLLALLIVLSRFLSIKTPIVKISLEFIPTMLAATWLGLRWTVVLKLLGDIIGATLFPSGAFFIGYTISAVMAGVIYALILYKDPRRPVANWKFALRVALATIIVAVVVNLGMNTLWTSITSGKAFMAILAGRVTTQLILVPIHIVSFIAIEALLRKPFQKYILRGEIADAVETPTAAKAQALVAEAEVPAKAEISDGDAADGHD